MPSCEILTYFLIGLRKHGECLVAWPSALSLLCVLKWVGSASAVDHEGSSVLNVDFLYVSKLRRLHLVVLVSVKMLILLLSIGDV
jgi:hypothetical protein